VPIAPEAPVINIRGIHFPASSLVAAMTMIANQNPKETQRRETSMSDHSGRRVRFDLRSAAIR
jgi:hypothetical protein